MWCGMRASGGVDTYSMDVLSSKAVRRWAAAAAAGLPVPRSSQVTTLTVLADDVTTALAANYNLLSTHLDSLNTPSSSGGVMSAETRGTDTESSEFKRCSTSMLG